MIKLMGNKSGHLPVQLAGGGASGSGTNVKATFVKASGDQVMLPYEMLECVSHKMYLHHSV